ncbi:MAG TPA: stage II sporulation protein M [Longimicrobiales bacterium]
MTQDAPPSVLAPRRADVETPEHVEIRYDLADLGSRFTALVVDAILVFVGLLVVMVGVPLLVARLGVGEGMFGGLTFGVAMLVAFALVWGYFVYFEGLRDGQTPGKRWLRIRVVHDGGYPLTVRGAAVRNLLRLIDIQPFPSWLVGGVAMMLHPRTKRIGDIAAETVVVRERTVALPPEDAAPAVVRGAPRLDDAELAALAQYVARRGELRPEARRRVAAQLVRLLAARFEGDARLAELGADAYLAVFHAEEVARRSAVGGAAGGAQAAALARRQRRVWDAYRVLLERARRRGLARLPEHEVSRFAALYRETAADLARARSYGASEALVYSLERWVGAGHNLLYRPARRSLRALRAWLAGGFPALVRARIRPIAVAAAVFYLPALVTFAAVREDPARVWSLLPAGMIARAEEAPEREARGEGYVEVPDVFMPMMASGIIANNVQVTFVAFAGGVLAGIGTLAVLVFNGVFLGAVAAAFANEGASLHLWTFVLPHGIIELTAICIAGGAGLWLGSALVLPGRRTRREMLALRGREAVSLLGGTAMLLGVAGMIEGFISPAPIPRALKLAFAAVFALLLTVYLLAAGRDEAARRRARAAGERDGADLTAALRV